MSTVIAKYGPMSLGELEICEEMLNSHGLFAMKLYVELQEVRRGHAPDGCTLPLGLNQTCTLCDLFEADGLLTEVENTIALYLDTKACLKEVREASSASLATHIRSGTSPHDARYSTSISFIFSRHLRTESRSQSVAIESTLAKAALYTTMTVGDNLRNHHTKWQARLQTAVLSTASRLGHHNHKSVTKGKNRKNLKLESDSRPSATSMRSLQDLSTHGTSDGRRYIVLEKCHGGCCPTLDDYAALSSTFNLGANKTDADTDAKRAGTSRSGSATTSKVIDPSMSKRTHQNQSPTKAKRKSKISAKSGAMISGTTTIPTAPGTTSKLAWPCSTQKLLLTPEVLAMIPQSSDAAHTTRTRFIADSDCDPESPLSTLKPTRDVCSAAYEALAMPILPSISQTEVAAETSVISSQHFDDQDPINDPRIDRLRQDLTKFDVIRRGLMEWCRVWTVDAQNDNDDLEHCGMSESMQSENRVPFQSEGPSRADDQSRLTDPDKTPRCGASEDVRFDCDCEDQERLRERWQIARQKQTLPKRTRVSLR